jgi:hypothetical protein
MTDEEVEKIIERHNWVTYARPTWIGIGIFLLIRLLFNL